MPTFKTGPLLAALAICLAATTAPADARPAADTTPSRALMALPEPDDDIVLPSRVAIPATRAEDALARAEAHIDDGEPTQAIAALQAVRQNLARADKAARRQMTSTTADTEDQETLAPAAVMLALSLDQDVVERTTELFHMQDGATVAALTQTLSLTQLTRARLVRDVLALDPDGPGADYADGMADSLDGYTDEIANLTEALSDDTLAAAASAALRTALSRSQATQARLTAAFGGGE